MNFSAFSRSISRLSFWSVIKISKINVNLPMIHLTLCASDLAVEMLSGHMIGIQEKLTVVDVLLRCAIGVSGGGMES